MKYFLVIILITGDVEQHVAIEQETLAECHELRDLPIVTTAYLGEDGIIIDTYIDEITCLEISYD